ncbi:XRE family transcriptional regulator [Streptomyces sp. 35G-GA-8]|uniref:helix-turn-helix domain-containing protein n=1 Tax=Streptomyces sp. 35G-GA-8 TaxID=2939434 RepID=UPI00201E8325|nr:XRE family transcriptional regulator [Streptomyces sp. 35G-GA-8]MCL7376218.1 XRE family transcriptional regulator [Streptomyces sp. 35G-GA-8]
MSGALGNAPENAPENARGKARGNAPESAMKSAVEKRAAECDRLAGELSALRARTGLSLVALAGRTPYSKSSWQRYLNGTKPLPRQAVVALCALAGEPPGRLLALWELADAAWSGRAAAAIGTGPMAGAGAGVGAGVGAEPGAVQGPSPPSPVPAPAGPLGPAGGEAPGRTPGSAPGNTPGNTPGNGPRGRRRTAVLAATAGVAAVTAVTVLGAWLSGDGGARRETPEDAAWSTVGPLRPSCTGPACEGEAPSLMGCGGEDVMTTLGSLTATGGQRLQLRYGETCRTVWVRATGLRVGDRVVLTVPGRREQQIAAVAPRDTGRYLVTPMVAAADPSEARACLLPGGGGEQECLGHAPRASAS